MFVRIKHFLTNRRATARIGRILGLPLLFSLFAASLAQAQDKPNILVLWGDDIG